MRLRERCPRCRTLTGVWLGDVYECHSCGFRFEPPDLDEPGGAATGGDREPPRRPGRDSTTPPKRQLEAEGQ